MVKNFKFTSFLEDQKRFLFLNSSVLKSNESFSLNSMNDFLTVCDVLADKRFSSDLFPVQRKKNDVKRSKICSHEKLSKFSSALLKQRSDRVKSSCYDSPEAKKRHDKVCTKVKKLKVLKFVETKKPGFSRFFHSEIRSKIFGIELELNM